MYVGEMQITFSVRVFICLGQFSTSFQWLDLIHEHLLSYMSSKQAMSKMRGSYSYGKIFTQPSLNQLGYSYKNKKKMNISG